jgi:hypothetical protein
MPAASDAIEYASDNGNLQISYEAGEAAHENGTKTPHVFFTV